MEAVFFLFVQKKQPIIEFRLCMKNDQKRYTRRRGKHIGHLKI